MIIPIPERVSLLFAFFFAAGLCALQLASKTELIFSLFCFFFVILSALAFNAGGGLTRPSGSYVFFFAMLAAIVGLVNKVIYWEPAQSHLQVPLLTIGTYVGAMAGMLAAASISRRFSLRKGLLQDVITIENMRLSMIGCVVFGLLFSFVAQIVNSSQTETVFTPFFRASNQLNAFLEVGIILGVNYEVRSSGGRRSLNFWILLAWFTIFFQGSILGYSKEALFRPFLCWLVAAAVLRYRFRPYQIIASALFLLFCFQYMVPYCQYGRNFRSTSNSLSQNLAVSRDLLLNLPEIRRIDAREREANTEELVTSAQFFNASHGLFDRLQMLSVDDGLDQYTDQNGPLGVGIMGAYIANIVPHFIWKNKPEIKTANLYGHELGALAPEDEDTSVSVSPVGEAYRLAKWPGVLVLAPVLWFVLFLVMDSLCGDLRRSPWGILVFASFAHIANEGGLAGPIYILSFGVFSILFVAFFARYILPVFVKLIVLPKRGGTSFYQPQRFVPRPLGTRENQ